MDSVSALANNVAPPLISKSKRLLWLRWALATLALVFGTLYYRGWSTQPLTLRDGRRFDVLNFDRHVSYTLSANGTRHTEHSFWVRYYANTTDLDSLRAEARHLAPALFPIADSLGYAHLKLEPSRPVFLRHFPLAVLSLTMDFVRDSSGAWQEKQNP
jgi:hypothetical protein